MLKSENIIKFLVDNKTLQRIPIYGFFRNHLNFRYYNKFLNSHVDLGGYDFRYINVYSVSDKYKVKIGKFCTIGAGLTIILSSAYRADWVSTFAFDGQKTGSFHSRFKKYAEKNLVSSKGDVTIGNDAWIGINTTIMSGVTIGNGAIIGANSVVTKNVEDYEIVAGNPAKHIRYRFKEEEITELKKIQWWNWPIEKIMENRKLIESTDIKEFIKRHGKNKEKPILINFSHE
ncbi:CatB-related O-acetyltransferase [Methanobacterium oryzae]|uniref:CatB-related O-acetyltransferase n=1 Tax=Methanobacterium oryzae TaxID=69540 RepID=UPI003D23F76A